MTKTTGFPGICKTTKRTELDISLRPVRVKTVISKYKSVLYFKKMSQDSYDSNKQGPWSNALSFTFNHRVAEGFIVTRYCYKNLIRDSFKTKKHVCDS